MGVDLAEVKGTGPSGRIVRADVEAAAKAPSAAPGRSESKATSKGAPSPAPMPPVGAALEKKSVALSNIRRTIAARLVESKTTVPHYQVTMTVDMDPLLTLRSQLNEQLKAQGVKLSVNDFLVRACALAMHQHPHINSSWKQTKDAASIELHDRVNVGVAISLPMERGGGLVVGVLRDCDRIGLRQISAETKRLADKARAKGLSIEEMDGSTFTISNLGMFGVEHFTAIINPPNTAILAVGAAVEKPVVRNGQIVVGHEMQMTMSSDHRVIDGAMAAEYLNTVKQLLEAPATLLV
jgi:pyruvate dehydrogenase E2 component (dihydrolipoamide acetyltransferase)